MEKLEKRARSLGSREKGLKRWAAEAHAMHTPGTRWNGGKGHSGNRVSNSVGSRKRSSQRERSGGTLFSDRGTHVRSIIDRNNIGIVPFPSRGTGFSWQSGRTNFERPFAETVEYRATPPSRECIAVSPSPSRRPIVHALLNFL